MKKELPLLSHCVVIGDDRKYLTMLVSLKCEVRIAGLRQGRGERFGKYCNTDCGDMIVVILICTIVSLSHNTYSFI